VIAARVTFAALVLSAAPAWAGDLDPRCRARDEAAAAKLKPLLDAVDIRSTTLAYAAMQRLISARVECGKAYSDNALLMYRQVDAMLGRPDQAVAERGP
jgi:hypothetical protein